MKEPSALEQVPVEIVAQLGQRILEADPKAARLAPYSLDDLALAQQGKVDDERSVTALFA